jgi:hypothetical protein
MFARDDRFSGSPMNIWGGSSLAYTDYDPCATIVCGSAALVERLVRDPEVETVIS